MSDETRSEWIGSKGVWTLLGVVLVAQAGALALVFGHEHAARRAEAEQLASDRKLGVSWRANTSRPIVRPRVAERAEARINPAELVIGVEVGGNARAYRLGALESPRSHLVNDLIGTVPVSVAYCNLTRCVSVYSDPLNQRPWTCGSRVCLTWR